MAHLPESVRGNIVSGLNLVSRGKVRDSYLQFGSNGDYKIFVTTNRASIFDFVLPFTIPYKGEVLNAINIFMMDKVLRGICPQDIEAYGHTIDRFLPTKLRNNPELQKTTTVVKRLPTCPFEAVVRNYLLGSSVKPYKEKGLVSGHALPAGLREGDELPYSIFTPSTKAEVGHDEPISFLNVEKTYGGEPERLSLQIMSAARKFLNRRGLEVADTKFEFAFKNGQFYLIDERVTPDSSRFWDLRALRDAQAKGGLPPHLDKQPMRDWGKHYNLDDKALDPESPETQAFIAGLPTPEGVIKKYQKILRYIAWRILGKKLELFQKQEMGIKVAPKPVNIQIILGSRSDLRSAEPAFNLLRNNGMVGGAQVNIISCHRNPEELTNFTASKTMEDTDVIIAGAGLAAALPGMTKALLKMNGYGHIPVIGVAFAGKNREEDDAARLSIEQLPGRPVETDQNGLAYFGSEGFINATVAAINDEFLPSVSVDKKAELNIPINL